MSLQQIRDLGLASDERRRLQVQLVIHNVLHVTWLKRLESSSASLLKSVQYYLKRLSLFEKYLDTGYIVTLADANTLEKEYEADIDQAFLDFEKYLDEVQAALDSGASADEIKRRGVERRPADPKVYNLEAMRKDLARDKAISELLLMVLSKLSKPENNSKLLELAKFIERITATQFYGNKVLVFSFFSDTIDYLENNLPDLVSKIPDFKKRSAFITGNSVGTVESRARRFSPKAKNYKLKDGETEIDFLFATDVLSEGQNLQDAGILINFDLHWNPVRMIQRNGRINRLGSAFSEVVIANAKPHDDLELYLRLVRRLERKIDTIKNSIGTDQSVLGEDENPIEFIDYYNDDKSKASAAAEQAAQAVGGQTAVLDFEDEFSFELRRFLAEHEDDGEIERIMAIPLGKWNYLPQKENGERTCLALERVIGRTSITGAPINETLFVRVDTSGAWYKAEHIEDTDALSIIKTTPDDNARTRDTIGADRVRVANRAATTARVKAESVSASFDPKPKMLEALTTMTAYVPQGTDLQSIVRNGIRNASHKREFERLVRKINSEKRERGSVYSTTVSRFERLMNELLSSLGEGREIEVTESVLFYHSPEDDRA
jgi:superfamily II DNA/RNA helicase